MKRALFHIAFTLLCFFASGQKLYIKTFGTSTNKAVIFLHGGPGFNCANFEGTTAKRLADSGYFVIVYDRRGEGRSKDPNAKYNFNETFNDLDSIYLKFNLKKAALIGHSFGGIVGTLYAEKNSNKVSHVFLASAPVSLQETFRTILSSCEKIYIQKNDTLKLREITKIRKLDTTSVDYYVNCFELASRNRFYFTKKPSDEMKAIYKVFAKDSLIRYTYLMTEEPPLGFLKNNNYTSIDLSNNIKDLVIKKVNLFGVYGMDDGLYSTKQIENLATLIGKNNVLYLENCSHNVFIDQQSKFMDFLINNYKN